MAPSSGLTPDQLTVPIADDRGYWETAELGELADKYQPDLILVDNRH